MRRLGAGIAAVAATLLVACDSGNDAAGKTRTFFIAADEVAWTYAPTGRNQVTGEPFDETANVFVRRGPDRIGHTYQKAVYREYTDGTFSKLKPREPRWRHLGLLGPVIHAEVGDTVRIHFRNDASSPTTIHAHGVFYDKASEGAPYDDNTSPDKKADDGVPPGGRHTYVWKVGERAGPEGHESSMLWMYHSHVDETKDTNSGLVGPIIVTKRGMARADGSPEDVDRELITYFSVIDENASWLLDRNIEQFTGKPRRVDRESEEFGESNLMHSINGFVYGNLAGLEMHQGEHVRWYVMTLGTEVDLHTPHWHGNVVTRMEAKNDMLELLPGSMMVADMVPDNPGTWLYHCHVNDHILAGMQALYTVRPHLHAD